VSDHVRSWLHKTDMARCLTWVRYARSKADVHPTSTAGTKYSVRHRSVQPSSSGRIDLNKLTENLETFNRSEVPQAFPLSFYADP
jgi:hypothetical protein